MGGFFGLDDPVTGIFAPPGNPPTSKGIICPNSANTNPVDETVVPAVSASGLKYDGATGEYIYVWKTDKTWNNSCRELTMTLKDGTKHSLYFQFLK